MRYFLIFTISFFIISCVSKDRESELLNRISKLETQLDACENDAERIIAKVEKAYSEKNYQLARQSIGTLYERHPESPKNSEFKELLITIELEELQEIKRKETEEKERIRLANLNNTGMWEVRYFVDDFGEPTTEGYIINKNLIRGTFSNTATQNSNLNVSFVISDSLYMSMILYEYAGNLPVKSHSLVKYYILIQDKDKKRHNINAELSSDRININYDRHALELHNILKKGGFIKFKIVEKDSETEYEFTIENADYYENAWNKLKSK